MPTWRETPLTERELRDRAAATIAPKVRRRRAGRRRRLRRAAGWIVVLTLSLLLFRSGFVVL